MMTKQQQENYHHSKEAGDVKAEKEEAKEMTLQLDHKEQEEIKKQKQVEEEMMKEYEKGTRRMERAV